MPALYPAAGMAGPGSAGGGGVGRSSANPGLAAGGGGAFDAAAAAGSVAALSRRNGRGRGEARGGGMNLLQQLEAEQVPKLAPVGAVPPLPPPHPVRVSLPLVQSQPHPTPA